MARTQAEKILDHMWTYGSITPLEALKEYGCMRLASRIADLKKAGYAIDREIISRKNKNGETVRFARYWLRQNGGEMSG